MKVITISIFMMLLLLLLTSVFWMVQPPRPPSVSIEQSVRGSDGLPMTTFRAGDILYIFSKQRLVRDTPRIASQSLWNDDTGVIAVRYADLMSPTPNPEGSTFAVPLPAYLEPGNYTHRVRISYGLNPLRQNEVFNLPNVAFKIIK